ncbi:MAG: hypothetical protein DMG41_35095 [Acidobacteria bacterium]|nr:MAG: hypothetical protein DMG42_01650 [Acidobacteriota bacterium]PYT81466.1 MAG: hypothetical protein DMG41_35095 [Acidobacteriota bacterium]
MIAGKSDSVFPLVTTSNFMSIVVVEQPVGGGVGMRACVVCFAVVKSKKDETRAAVEIARKRYGRFIIIAPLIRESGLDFKARLGELCTPRLAHASPAEKDGLRPGSIARTGNLSPGSRTQASAQQGSPQSGDCSNWLNGNLCLQKV